VHLIHGSDSPLPALAYRLSSWALVQICAWQLMQSWSADSGVARLLDVTWQYWHEPSPVLMLVLKGTAGRALTWRSPRVSAAIVSVTPSDHDQPRQNQAARARHGAAVNICDMLASLLCCCLSDRALSWRSRILCKKFIPGEITREAENPNIIEQPRSLRSAAIRINRKQFRCPLVVTEIQLVTLQSEAAKRLLVACVQNNPLTNKIPCLFWTMPVQIKNLFPPEGRTLPGKPPGQRSRPVI